MVAGWSYRPWSGPHRQGLKVWMSVAWLPWDAVEGYVCREEQEEAERSCSSTKLGPSRAQTRRRAHPPGGEEDILPVRESHGPWAPAPRSPGTLDERRALPSNGHCSGGAGSPDADSPQLLSPLPLPEQQRHCPRRVASTSRGDLAVELGHPPRQQGASSAKPSRAQSGAARHQCFHRRRAIRTTRSSPPRSATSRCTWSGCSSRRHPSSSPCGTG
jgi:hypothetical protein